jgi:hypothetical protein
MQKALFRLAAYVLAAGLMGGAAAAQTETKRQVKALSLSALTAQGFEVKAITGREALIVQKGRDVYWCTLRLANTAPLSYLSECYSIH